MLILLHFVNFEIKFLYLTACTIWATSSILRVTSRVYLQGSIVVHVVFFILFVREEWSLLIKGKIFSNRAQTFWFLTVPKNTPQVQPYTQAYMWRLAQPNCNQYHLFISSGDRRMAINAFRPCSSCHKSYHDFTLPDLQVFY